MLGPVPTAQHLRPEQAASPAEKIAEVAVAVAAEGFGR